MDDARKTWIVRAGDRDSRVEAARCTEAGEWTLFEDAHGTVVASFKTASISAIAAAT